MCKRTVEWCFGVVSGSDRLFIYCLSRGNERIWKQTRKKRVVRFKFRCFHFVLWEKKNINNETSWLSIFFTLLSRRIQSSEHVFVPIMFIFVQTDGSVFAFFSINRSVLKAISIVRSTRTNTINKNASHSFSRHFSHCKLNAIRNKLLKLTLSHVNH